MPPPTRRIAPCKVWICRRKAHRASGGAGGKCGFMGEIVLQSGGKWDRVPRQLTWIGMAGLLPLRHPRSGNPARRALRFGVPGSVRVHAGREEPPHDPGEVPGRLQRRARSSRRSTRVACRSGRRTTGTTTSSRRSAGATRSVPRRVSMERLIHSTSFEVKLDGAGRGDAAAAADDARRALRRKSR